MSSKWNHISLINFDFLKIPKKKLLHNLIFTFYVKISTSDYPTHALFRPIWNWLSEASVVVMDSVRF